MDGHGNFRAINHQFGHWAAPDKRQSFFEPVNRSRNLSLIVLLKGALDIKPKFVKPGGVISKATNHHQPA